MKLWLGTRVCVQWSRNKGIFESKLVYIAFWTILIYVSFLDAIFTMKVIKSTHTPRGHLANLAYTRVNLGI